ncbi:MAG: aldehyde dehydrogenase family protein [Clostridiales bacterium]
MEENNIKNIISAQRKYFDSGDTRNIDYRIKNLEKLKTLILENEDLIYQALKKDLGRDSFDSFTAEVSFMINDLDYIKKRLKKWAMPKKVSTNLLNQIGKSYIYNDSYGCVLIIGPWNYPFQLTINPLIGAIAAGNCAIIKPSELSPSCSKVITDIINNNFSNNYLHVIEGDADTSKKLLLQKWDFIFFTGSTLVGKKVMEAAAKNLTPLALELGGKNPCIVDDTTDIDLSAKRITWGKFFNLGQTCIAPDYILVKESVKDKLVKSLIDKIKDFYNSNNYGKIININHFDRLKGSLESSKIIYGGKTNEKDLYISPTLLEDVPKKSVLYNDEIFGPLLPIFSYKENTEVISFIKNKNKPLVIYIFSKNTKFCDSIIENTSSGSISINDTLMFITNHKLPFGGIESSGIGSYHGKFSFDCFSHKKSITKKGFFPEISVRYPPYNKTLSQYKKLLQFFK